MLEGIITVGVKDPSEFLGASWIACQNLENPPLIVLKSKQTTIDLLRKATIQKRNDCLAEQKGLPTKDYENSKIDLATLITNAHLSPEEMNLLYDFYWEDKKQSEKQIETIIDKIRKEIF